jgi:hypothetical protein
VSDGWEVKRRPRRTTAMQRHRFVEAHVAAGASAVPFPGTPMPEPAGARERLVSGGASLLLHGALILALVLVANVAREEIQEQIIEVTRVTETREEPAPRPRAIAESAMRSFAPAPMAVAPQIVNPTVIQPRIANVPAPVQVADLQQVQAPREITAPTLQPVPQASPLPSPIALPTSAPRVVDTSDAPALSGPVDYQAPVGTSSGPRQVVSTGDTFGVGDATALGTSSSVQDGIDSNRDVLGGKTGERASVNTAVGANGGRGTGGSGTGLGGDVSQEDCIARSEVKAYIAHIKERMFSRWRQAPTGLADGVYRVSLSFRLDPSGSASEVNFVSADNPAVGASAVEAMRAASPFDQMSDRVRCLAGDRLTATFTLENLATN